MEEKPRPIKNKVKSIVPITKLKVLSAAFYDKLSLNEAPHQRHTSRSKYSGEHSQEKGQQTQCQTQYV